MWTHSNHPLPVLLRDKLIPPSSHEWYWLQNANTQNPNTKNVLPNPKPQTQKSVAFHTLAFCPFRPDTFTKYMVWYPSNFSWPAVTIRCYSCLWSISVPTPLQTCQCSMDCIGRDWHCTTDSGACTRKFVSATDLCDCHPSPVCYVSALLDQEHSCFSLELSL